MEDRRINEICYNISMSKVSSIVLTYNEEQNIKDCLASLIPISDDIFVIDSFSTDKTVEIAKSLGAKVIQHEFKYHADQVNFALSNINFKNEWIIRLDADERLTNESRNEIDDLTTKHLEDDVNGIVLRFNFSFMGKELKHGGVYPFRKLSVFKKRKARVEDKEMDEHFVLDGGKTVKAKYDCEHKDYKGLFEWVAKHNKYALRESNDYYKKSLNSKRKFYYSFPSFFRAKLLYLYCLLFKFAWLDGRPGLIYAYLHTHWYRYLVDCHIYDRKKRNK